jgi:serine/threonine-protein kinase
MEYLQGRDLERELHARRTLPVAEIAAYSIQACDVLSEAHAAGVVHRDLKPANLFLTRLPNGTNCIKVLDFGIAKQSEAGRASSMTQTTSVFGTPLYMSPEQMKSAKSVDARSDIWSLGVVIYELATGALPYDAESMTALVAKVMTEPPVPLRVRQPALPPAFEQVVSRCLERDPARRFSSAAELAAALAPFTGFTASRGSIPDLGSQGYGPASAATGPSSYGTGQSPAYGAAQTPGFGGPSTGSNPAYGAAQTPGFGGPSTGSNPGFAPTHVLGAPGTGPQTFNQLGGAATHMAVTSQAGGPRDRRRARARVRARRDDPAARERQRGRSDRRAGRCRDSAGPLGRASLGAPGGPDRGTGRSPCDCHCHCCCNRDSGSGHDRRPAHHQAHHEAVR